MSELVLEKNNEKILPTNWLYVTLDNLVKQEKNSIKRGPFGSTIKKEYFVPSGFKIYEQKNVIYNDFSIGNYYITKEKFNELDDFEIKNGDILISCSGTIGKIAIVPESIQRGIINQALLKITLDNGVTDTKYFVYLLKSYAIQNQILNDARGSAMKNFASVKELNQILFPIPPLNEQKRIVEKIEELFQLIDETIQLIRKVNDKILQYKYAFLHDQFNHDWEKKTLDSISNFIRDGTHNPPKRIEEGIPLLSARNIQDGFIDWNKKFSKISKTDFNVMEKNNSIEKNNILLTIVGTIGRSCVVDTSKQFAVQRSVAILKMKNEVLPHFVKYYFNTLNFQNELKKNARGVAQVGVYLNTLKKLIVPIPDLETQKLVIGNISKALSLIEKNYEINEIMFKQLQKSKASILKHAFEGKLVPQDPNDEPAEILLEKIKQEKEQLLQKQKPSRRKKNGK